MRIQLFSWGHVILLLSTVLAGAGLIVLFALWLKKHPKASKITIALLLFFGLVIHFLRLAFTEYRVFPWSIQYITPMSISAFNALTFFFIFLWGNKMWKSYMFYVGIFTGVMACLLPITAYGRPAFGFDAIRFFVIHGIICIAPILMVISGNYRPNWRSAYFAPLLITVVLLVVLIDEVMLTALGIVDQDMGTLLSHADRNGALVWGPEPQGGVATTIFNALCPKFFKTALFDIPSIGLLKGDLIYWPVIWIVIPGLCIVSPVCLLIGIGFDFKSFKRDMKICWYTLKRNKTKVTELRAQRKLRKIKR
ncbi:MAG: YwaF family protein [Christensenellaceae bacterium]|jgi:uncharacterized membrane protein YwaF|nr:YwaF family protein [Christensenellaceae bacterium]